MSKRTSRTRRRPSRKKRRGTNWTSILIPIIVGLVVLAVIVAAIVSIENQGLAPGAQANNVDGVVPLTTAQPQPTRAIPYPDIPRISVNDAQAALDSGQALLIDVRSQDSYAKSHVAGAVSIPEGEISARLDELPRDKEIVLYCT